LKWSAPSKLRQKESTAWYLLLNLLNRNRISSVRLIENARVRT
jgi:hypothetical protein